MDSYFNIPIAPIPGFSEPFSAITHLLGAIVFLILGIELLVRSHVTLGKRAALLVYIVAVIFALSMSGVFHLLSSGSAAKAVLQRLDHAAIFFLIAATYTPVHTIVFRGVMRWGVLVIVWCAAITGITLKSIFFFDIPEWVGLSLYLGLGWFGVFSTYQMYRRFGFHYIKLIVYGALAYTCGGVFEYLRIPILIPEVIGPHELFHIFVLIGISMHWMFIRQISLSAGSLPANDLVTA
ncbi:MAG: hemolysin III family protein [Gammaproteobacteria bacterium]|jgi:channel protein (hemolysin III family)|nr:hemolysin III family protein [Gammaproteobacteria bacterium]